MPLKKFVVKNKTFKFDLLNLRKRKIFDFIFLIIYGILYAVYFYAKKMLWQQFIIGAFSLSVAKFNSCLNKINLIVRGQLLNNLYFNA